MEFGPTATPIAARGKWLWTVKDYGMHMDFISLVFGETWLQVTPLPQLTTSLDVACHDPPWPSWPDHQTASTRAQRRRSNGWTQSTGFVENLKMPHQPPVVVCRNLRKGNYQNICQQNQTVCITQPDISLQFKTSLNPFENNFIHLNQSSLRGTIMITIMSQNCLSVSRVKTNSDLNTLVMD